MYAVKNRQIGQICSMLCGGWQQGGFNGNKITKMKDIYNNKNKNLLNLDLIFPHATEVI